MAKSYKKVSTKGSKATTTKISSSSGGSVTISTGGGGSAGNGGSSGSAGGGRAGSNSNTNDLNYRPARHFYVVPTESRNDNNHNAATLIVAPYRTYLGQVGPYVEADGKVANDIDGKFYINSEGFAEVVGVVPISIKFDDTGFRPIADGEEIFKYVESIDYRYLPFGHKEIRIEYHNTDEDYALLIIQFNVLFSDGSVITVKQPIVSNLLTKPLGIKPTSGNVPKNLENNGGIQFVSKGERASDDDGGHRNSTSSVLSFVSAGSWITGNFKGGDSFIPKKHEWWRIATSNSPQTRSTSLGGIFHQQAYESYNSASGNASNTAIRYTVERASTVDFAWNPRYNPNNRSSFARRTGSDSFEGSAANVLVGSSLYDDHRYTKYKLNGSYVRPLLADPKWESVNALGASNWEESAEAYSHFPTNRFTPVNSHFGSGIGHSIQHDGLCFSFRSTRGRSEFGDLEYLHEAHHSLALSLRGLIKGLTLNDPNDGGDGGFDDGDDWTQTGDGHGGPGTEGGFDGGHRSISSNQYHIPSSSTYPLTAQLYNNSAAAGELSMLGPVGGSMSNTFLSLGLCHADIFANLFTGNRNQFFQTTAAGTNEQQKLIFAAAMGKKYQGGSGSNFGTSQWYAENIFNTDDNHDTTEENLGVVLPFYGKVNTKSFKFPGNLAPIAPSAGGDYTGNVVLKALPFYYHLDFPVIDDTYTIVDKLGKVQRKAETITQFQPTGQGVDDYVNSKFYLDSTNKPIAILPIRQNTAKFNTSFHRAHSPQYVNLDPNSTYTLDNTHAPGYSDDISAHTVGFNRDSRQPWGKINVDLTNQNTQNTLAQLFADPYSISLNSYAAGKLKNINSGAEIRLTFIDEGKATQLEFKYINGVSTDNIAKEMLVNGVLTSFFDPTADHVTSSQFQTELVDGITTTDSLGYATNVFDIFDWQYRPGQFLANTSLYPYNSDDVTASEVEGQALTGQTAQQLERSALQITTVSLTGQSPANDRAYIDVDVEDTLSEGWNSYNADGLQYNAVSQIRIQKKDEPIDHVGGIKLNADVDSIFWSKEFDFVVPGLTDYEGGYVEDEKPGCMDANAENFNPEATVDDGSCIYCKPQEDPHTHIAIPDIHQYLQYGVNATILDAYPVMNGVLYGLVLTEGNAPWQWGNIGNAVNYSDPSLGLSIDNPAATAMYTSLQFEVSVSSSAIIGAAQNGGSTVSVDAWQQYWLLNVFPGSFSLLIYDIEYFDDDNYDWAITGQPGVVNTYTTLPLTDQSAPSVIVLDNLGTTQNLKFGTENFPQDIGNVSLGLEAGKHYLAVLKLEPRCGNDYYLAYNFWVLYCDCNLESAENFGGNNWNYPWSDTNAFPGGWGGPNSPFDFCTDNPKTSRVWKRTKSTDSNEGLCIIPPAYVDCSTFIDWCIVGDTFDCELTGNVEDGFFNVGTGTLSINVFGVYTGSDAGGSEYALYVAGQLFQFSIELYSYPPFLPEVPIQTIIINDLDDYMSLSGGISPQNMQFVQVLFENIPQGAYYVVLNQLGPLFPMQDPTLGPCLNVGTSVGSGVIAIGGNTICEGDIICGCNDEEAVNYDPNATTDVNGNPFDECNDQCIYEDCTEIFSQVLIASGTITNSLAECGEGQEDLDGDGEMETFYYLLDTASGGAAFTVTNTENVNFNIGIVSLINGNQSVGTQILFQYYTQNYEAIVGSVGQGGVAITQGSTVVGAFLNTNITTIPTGLFSANGLYAGNFLVFAIPHSTAIDPDNNIVTCENELLEIIDNFFTFQVLLDTSGVTDCTEGCNEVTNPEDCDEYVAGCTDESASNYNPLANYDSGDCEYGGSEDCVTTPDLPECEECEGTSDSPEGGLRQCDEENGNEAGCGDPFACNYAPDANLWMPNLCEYCCDGDEDCVDNGDDDECQDEFGNVDPDCITSECPDQSNPDCDQPPVNPCPEPGDCPEPPIPDCIQLGNCDDEGGDDDPDVIIDDVIVEEISCDPLFNGLKFSEWQIQAMSCSANEGTKMMFKLRSGVKQDPSDMIKLTLINYLFNQGLDLACMYSCDKELNETNTTRNERGVRDCVSNWKLNGAPTWTPKSTYKRGEIVRILRNVRGVTRASYHIAKKDIPAQQISPTSKISNNSFWSRCTTRKAQKPAIEGVSYLKTLYQFMIKHCQNCSIRPRGKDSLPNNIGIYPSGKDADDSTKSIKSVSSRTDDNEITF